MLNSKSRIAFSILGVICFIDVIIVNTLSVTIPLGGMTTRFMDKCLAPVVALEMPTKLGNCCRVMVVVVGRTVIISAVVDVDILSPDMTTHFASRMRSRSQNKKDIIEHVSIP